jgi:paraquat-inducible protein B
VSARTHPRAIGVFVLLAVALVLSAVVVLSSGAWFRERDQFSVYFPGSIRGLNKGAPVTFRGIKLGEVTEVQAVLTGKPEPPIQIEVVIEMFGSVVKAPPGVSNPFAHLTSAQKAAALIERGIRGKLQSQSLLTGQKYIDFDFLPDEPARLSGLRPRYPELPTTPTAMEKLGDKIDDFMTKLAELPLDQMLEDLQRALRSVKTILESPDVREALAGARRGAAQVEPTLVDARAALADARKLMDKLGGEAGDTAAEARETIRRLRTSLDQVDKTLGTLDDTLGGTDEMRVRVTQTVEELDRTLKALRNLVDYIQTHPEAVVLGKAREEEKH